MRISIITVVLNGVKEIEKTIKSIINQEYTQAEYIVVDGCSTDGTWELIQKYSDKISCCIKEKDKGIYDAMNKGIRMATGDVVMFVNAGDTLMPRSCKYIANIFLDNPKIDVLLGRVFYTRDGKRIGISRHNRKHPWLGMPCCHQGIVAKKNVFNMIEPFNTKYKICADYDWLYYCLSSGKEFFWSNEILSEYDTSGISSIDKEKVIGECQEISFKYCKNQDSKCISNQYSEKIREHKYKSSIISNYYDSDISLRQILPAQKYVIWGAGISGYDCLKLLLSNNYNVDLIVDSNKELVEEVKSIMGVTLALPGEYLVNYNVIISSKKHREEIEKNLKGICHKDVTTWVYPDFLALGAQK